LKVAYLDTSAIVKRYVEEPGSEVISGVYNRVLSGELKLAFLVWNIGEVLGVLDKYFKRGWLSNQDYRRARYLFIGETLRLLKLRLLHLIPVRTRLLMQALPYIEKYHLYVADALQVVTAKHVRAQTLYTGDKHVHEVAIKEGISSAYLI